MTIHIDLSTSDQMQSAQAAIENAAMERLNVAPDRKRILARKIEFHHGIKEGDSVFISHRRAFGIAEELLVKHPNPRGSCDPHGVFRVRLEDGSIVEEHPEHLTNS